MSECDMVADADIVIVGGANSVGQAAVYFSEYASSATIFRRAAALGRKMSSYLVEQIAARPNITVRVHPRRRD